ncbi:hypothetical protein T265_05248 [Opisthorchis viverrini]|uniref:Uncharacterized protein n=1 Tax=Opisthorchis viverrini TaxID=6198 RepID=A0A074ZKA6_OPIVI|nr:hypothetical protein T265_05248 [Opisthorchis viverrini]KER27758.1 hypothetical protein T265_05248 [Opisthorchis viverrini]
MSSSLGFGIAQETLTDIRAPSIYDDTNNTFISQLFICAVQPPYSYFCVWHPSFTIPRNIDTPILLFHILHVCTISVERSPISLRLPAKSSKSATLMLLPIFPVHCLQASSGVTSRSDLAGCKVVEASASSHNNFGAINRPLEICPTLIRTTLYKIGHPMSRPRMKQT